MNIILSIKLFFWRIKNRSKEKMIKDWINNPIIKLVDKISAEIDLDRHNNK